MKKKRLLSLLLTAALCMSALPAVSAAETELAKGDNVLEKATVSYSGATKAFTDASEDGDGAYLHVYNRNDRYSGMRWYFGLLDEGTYYVSFDARLPYEVWNGGGENTRLNGYGEAGNWHHWDPAHIELTEEWQSFEASLEVGADAATLGDGEVHFALLGSTDKKFCHPYDVDNLKLYTKNTDGSVNEVLFSADFDTGFVEGVAPGEFGAYKRDGGTAVADFDVVAPEDYTRVIGNGSDSTSVTYTFENYVLPAGIYDFTGDIRYAVYNFNNYNNSNNSTDMTVTATIGGETVTLASGKLTTEWETVKSQPIVVSEATAITELKVVTAKKNSVDFKNFSLTLGESLTSEIVGTDENLLNGAFTTSNRVTVEEVTVTDAKGNPVESNGYLRVSELPSAVDYAFRIDSQYLPTMGRTYYIGFNVRLAGDTDPMSIRLAGNSRSQEREDNPEIKNFNYLKPTENSDFKNIGYDKSGGGGWFMDGTDLIVSDWKYYEAQYTPIENPNNGIVIGFLRAPGSSYRMPYDIDDFEIFYRDGNGKKVVVYSDNFDGEDAASGVQLKEAGAMDVITEVSATVSTIEASASTPAKLTYTLSGELADAKYSFRIDLRANSAGNATVYYTLADGTVKELTTAELGANWNTVYGVIRLAEGEKLGSITVETDVTTKLSFKDAILLSRVPSKNEGMPNVGIVMMLLLKKQGGSKTKTVKTELIENGNLEANVIIKDVGASAQTAADAGWYAKIDAAKSTRLELVKEDGNSFIRVRDLDKSQRGIYFNSGVILEAGTYTLSVDLRVSEAETDANYTAYTWHGKPGEYQNMRVTLTGAGNINSPTKESGKGYDLNTFIDTTTGSAVGWEKKITGEWTTYTDTVVVDEPTLAVFKIGGYTGGDKDSHGFDIDNISIVGYKTVVVEGEASADADGKNENFESLIPNGNFAEAPVVDSGAYDAAKANTWFENDGDGYVKDNKGQDLKDQPIYIDHKIELVDGYLKFSGRTNNLRRFYYNSGVTLEPGSYTLTADFKTANKGETCSVRMAVPGLFSPTTDDALDINNNWKTMTIRLDVKEATLISFEIWGGPGAGYKHDICIDNIVLTKN